MSGKKPASFKDLDVKELRRSAVEDFAVEASAADNKPTVIAALVESGVTWADYVAQHPEVAPDPVVAPAPVAPVVPEREHEPDRGNVVTSTSLDAGSIVTDNIGVGTIDISRIHVQEPLAPAPTDKYLVKMTRENPRYDTRGYTFTQQHPYNLVNGEDLEYILTKEDGFRQAFPSELAEYYG